MKYLFRAFPTAIEQKLSKARVKSAMLDSVAARVAIAASLLTEGAMFRLDRRNHALANGCG